MKAEGQGRGGVGPAGGAGGRQAEPGDRPEGQDGGPRHRPRPAEDDREVVRPQPQAQPHQDPAGVREIITTAQYHSQSKGGPRGNFSGLGAWFSEVSWACTRHMVLLPAPRSFCYHKNTPKCCQNGPHGFALILWPAAVVI